MRIPTAITFLLLAWSTTGWAADRPETGFRLELEFGPLIQRDNALAAPPEGGSLLDFSEFQERGVFTAQSTLTMFARGQSDWSFVTSPLELRNRVQFEDPIDFANVGFAPDTDTATRFRFNEFRLRYRKQVLERGRWDVRLGASLAYQETRVNLLQGPVTAQVEDSRLVPLVHAAVIYPFADEVDLILDVDAMMLSDYEYINSSLVFQYRPYPQWDLSFGLRILARDFREGDLDNDFVFDNVVARVGYSFGQDRSGPRDGLDLGVAGTVATVALTGGLKMLANSTDVEAIQDTGDVLQIALPLSALAASFLFDDREGRSQFLRSIIATQATVEALKFTSEKLRPDETSPRSFPSGHAAAAFSGASFLYRRYGPRWGIPAYIGAGFTAFSRVRAERHFFDDVLAGASIAVLYNFFFTDPGPQRFAIVPVPLEDGVVVGFHGRW